LANLPKILTDLPKRLANLPKRLGKIMKRCTSTCLLRLTLCDTSLLFVRYKP
jgi:hypothetical protein